MKNYYDILGVSLWAPEDDIKKSYRKLAFKFHPDYNQGDKFFEERFRDIQEAYDVLISKEKRVMYDDRLRIFLFYGSYRQQTSTNPQNFYNKEPNIHNTDSRNSAGNNTKKNKGNMLIVLSWLRFAKNTISKIIHFSINIGATLLGYAIIGGIGYGLFKACEPNRTSTPINNIENGNLDESFKNPDTTKNIPKITPEQAYQIKKRELLAQGWSEENIGNGIMPSCYNFKPKYGKLKNYLDVSVGGNTNVVIKLIEQNTDKCIRYVYVNSKTSYKLKNIPEGVYYLKIAYGSDWLSHVEKSKCIGKFLRNPLYKKGDEVLDFNRKYTIDGYSIPSFSLKLEIIQTDIQDPFLSQSITEDDFNN